MTEPELVAVIHGIAPVVRDYVQKSLGEMMTRVAAAELRVDLKAAETTPLLSAVAELTKENAALRDRIVVLETKAVGPSADVLTVAIGDVKARQTLTETALTELGKETVGLRERVAVVEVRAQVPGPAGADGVNGKDGADGIGFDDLAVEFDGERTLAVTFVKGEQRKSFPLALPYLKYQGIYQQGHTYVPGDTVTWGGHLWHCRSESILPPGDGSKVWQMCVRKGDRGKDGAMPSTPTIPVVSVGRPR